MTPDPTPDSFRYEVLAIARQLYPGAVPSWRLGSDKAEVIWGDRAIFLGHLYALVRPMEPVERARRIRDWLQPFSPESQAKYEMAEEATDDWRNARPLLRPRIQAQVLANDLKTIVRQPFFPRLMITYTLDLGDRDSYVLDKKLAGWAVSIDEVHAQAIANLEGMSTELPLFPERHDGLTGSFLLLETGDDYDAARLLLPGFRARLLAEMGPSLRAGIPSRSFLYVWSPDLGIRRHLVDMLREDATRLPHPLTDAIFAFDADGLRLAEPEGR